MLKLTRRIAIRGSHTLHDREKTTTDQSKVAKFGDRLFHIHPLPSGLVCFVFTSSSTGPVPGAPGPAESRWRKQKFGSPLPTSLESCWATTTRPDGCPYGPLALSSQIKRNGEVVANPTNPSVLKRRGEVSVSRVFSF